MARSNGTQMELKCESVIIDEKRLRYWEESEFKDALSFADDKIVATPGCPRGASRHVLLNAQIPSV
jgi:hypothetical protein